jgi:hypothetical protein
MHGAVGENIDRDFRPCHRGQRIISLVFPQNTKPFPLLGLRQLDRRERPYNKVVDSRSGNSAFGDLGALGILNLEGSAW